MGKMDVANDSQAPIKTGTSETTKPKEGKKEEKNPCSDDFTLIQIKKVWPNATNLVWLQGIVDELNKSYTVKNKQKKLYEIFELDTCLKRAHFFAQAFVESNTDLSGAFNGESLNYSVEALRSGYPFSVFKNNKKYYDYADEIGRKTEIDSKTKKKKIIHPANQEEIANIAYDDDNRGKGYKLGNINKGDGWKFRGRGLMQITGRSVSIVQETSLLIEKTNIEANCIVQFRPQSNWKGEFGFDWFRMEDTEKICGVKIPGDINYANSIGSYDKYPSIQSAKFTEDIDMVNKLKSDYGKIYSVPWLKKNNNSIDYIVPCIIAPQFRIVTLSVGVNLQNKKEPPKSLVVAYDKKLFKVQTSLGEGNNSYKEMNIENDPIYNYAKIPINTKEDFYSLPNEVKITCLTKNIRNSEIKVLADGKDAGFLNIYANIEQEIKIILISVKADFGHPIGENGEKNKGKIRGKEEFKKVLNSIGIRPTFEEIELDLTKTRNGLYENTDLKNASIINGAGDLKVLSGNVKGKDFDEYLEDEFKNRIKDSNGNFLYDNYLRIYYVNQVAKMWVAGGEGQVGGKGEINKGVCVMYIGGTLIDVVHESLHALGLGHSFSAKDVKPEQKFVYKYAKTDNYMDYGHLGNPIVTAVSLWKWQWGMLIGKNKTTTAQKLITVSKSKVPTSQS